MNLCQLLDNNFFKSQKQEKIINLNPVDKYKKYEKKNEEKIRKMITMQDKFKIESKKLMDKENKFEYLYTRPLNLNKSFFVDFQLSKINTSNI